MLSNCLEMLCMCMSHMMHVVWDECPHNIPDLAVDTEFSAGETRKCIWDALMTSTEMAVAKYYNLISARKRILTKYGECGITWPSPTTSLPPCSVTCVNVVILLLDSKYARSMTTHRSIKSQNTRFSSSVRIFPP